MNVYEKDWILENRVFNITRGIRVVFLLVVHSGQALLSSVYEFEPF